MKWIVIFWRRKVKTEHSQFSEIVLLFFFLLYFAIAIRRKKMLEFKVKHISIGCGWNINNNKRKFVIFLRNHGQLNSSTSWYRDWKKLFIFFSLFYINYNYYLLDFCILWWNVVNLFCNAKSKKIKCVNTPFKHHLEQQIKEKNNTFTLDG